MRDYTKYIKDDPLPCPIRKGHKPHEWENFNIDRNTYELVWCEGER